MSKSKSSAFSEIKSFGNAFKGIGNVIRTEKHFRFHLFAALCVVLAGFYFNVSSMEWIALALAIGLVLAAEMFNSAVEMLCDYLTLQYDERIGKIKDIAAGSVLVSSIIAAAIGVLVFGNYIYSS